MPHSESPYSDSVRARLRAFLSQPDVVTTLRLSLFSVYGIVIIGQDIANWEVKENYLLWALDIVLWTLILIDYVLRIVHSSDKRTFVLSNLGYPIFIITGAMVPFDHPWLVALPLILGYALQVREFTAGHALTFSIALIGFILAICTLGLYGVEKDEPQTDFANPGEAFSWAIARLFRVYGSNTPSPVTESGREIAFVMGVAAVIAAGLFTGQVIRWLVRADDEKVKDEEGGPQISAEDVAALRDDVARMSEQLNRMAEVLDRQARDGQSSRQ